MFSLNLFTTALNARPPRFSKLNRRLRMQGRHCRSLVPLRASDLLLLVTSYHCGLGPGGFHLLMYALNRFEILDSFNAKL